MGEKWESKVYMYIYSMCAQSTFSNLIYNHNKAVIEAYLCIHSVDIWIFNFFREPTYKAKYLIMLEDIFYFYFFCLPTLGMSTCGMRNDKKLSYEMCVCTSMHLHVVCVFIFIIYVWYAYGMFKWELCDVPCSGCPYLLFFLHIFPQSLTLLCPSLRPWTGQVEAKAGMLENALGTAHHAAAWPTDHVSPLTWQADIEEAWDKLRQRQE